MFKSDFKTPWITAICLVAALIFSCARFATAQDVGLFEEVSELPAQHLIDLPTASALPKGVTSLELRISSVGGLLGGLQVGLGGRLALGISYGGNNIVGSGKITWNPRPEVTFRYLVIPESDRAPNVAVGFESQGYGPYDDTLNRYQLKSRGFYSVVSRDLHLAGKFVVLGGLNYSVENKDTDSRLSVFLGTEKSINEHLSIIAEYDFARNDNLGLPGYGRDKGYLNVGVRAMLGGGVGLAFELKNLTDNRVGGASPSRELKIMYASKLAF